MAVGDKNAPAIDKPTRTRPMSRSIRGITSRARPTARAAAWSSTRLPGGRRVRVRGHVHQRRQLALRGRRHLDRRPARGAARV
jgi:hypothetical protein